MTEHRIEAEDPAIAAAHHREQSALAALFSDPAITTGLGLMSGLTG